jgi:hypothetical protein
MTGSGDDVIRVYAANGNQPIAISVDVIDRHR